jgi:hypothetical protein
MAAPNIKNGGAAFTSNTAVPAASLTLTKPTGANAPAVGDLLLIIVGNDDNTATAQWDNTTNKPTGFTLIGTAGSDLPDCHLAAFWRIADGTEGATVAVPAQSSDDYWGYYIVVENADQTTPINASTFGPSASSANPQIANSITTGVDDCLVFYCLSADGGDTFPFSVNTANGWTATDEVAEIQAGTGAANCAGTFGARVVATAGATGNCSIQMTVGDGGCTGQIAIAPPAGPTISSVGVDDEVDDAETGVAVVGTTFEATQGTGKVEISNNSDYATGTKVAQTVTSWGAASITITVVMGAIGPGDHYLWVTNNSAQRNATGFPVHVYRAHAFEMSLSANFAPSGTTAQLTAPAGKTTADMGGGRIEEALNPSTTNTDVTADDYREDEWCIKAVDASRDVTYAFRVLYGGIVPDTLTVTPKLTVSAGASLAADSGSYAWTGTAASLEYGSLVNAAAGSYAWSGVAASLEYGSVLSAESGTYAWAGQDVTFPLDTVLSAEGGSYNWTGQDASLEFGAVVSAESGTYAWSGTAASLEYGSLVSAEAASYSWTGVDASLEFGAVVSAESGAYTWAGTAASLEFGATLTAEAASYAWTGQDATFPAGLTLSAESGSYSWSGQVAGLLHAGLVSAEGGSYAWSGQVASLEFGTVLSAEGGAYNWSGSAAGLLADSLVTAGAGSYAWTGQDATLTLSGANVLTAESGTYSWIGAAANLNYTGAAEGAGGVRKRKRYVLPDGQIKVSLQEAYSELERQIRARAVELDRERASSVAKRKRSRSIHPRKGPVLLADLPVPEIIKRLPETERAKIDMSIVDAAQRLARQAEEEEQIVALLLLVA